MKIRIKPSFWLVLCLIFYFQPAFVAVALLSSLIHEAGHMAAILISGGSIQTFELSVFGAVFDANISRLSKVQKVLVYLSGPTVSIAASLILFCLCGKSFSIICFSAGVINFTLGLINLLPIRPLDGGNALTVLADSSIYFKIMETGFRIVFAAVILAAAVYLKSVFLLLFLIYVLFVCRI